jgi:hypothetical protein
MPVCFFAYVSEQFVYLNRAGGCLIGYLFRKLALLSIHPVGYALMMYVQDTTD